jgi:hypothetical protein
MKNGLAPAFLLTTLLLIMAPLCQGDPVLEWNDLYDGGGLYTDSGTAALADANGHLIVGGESHDGVYGSDMLIRKLDRTTHAPIWTTRYPAFDGNDMALMDMVWDGYGDVLVAGYIRGCEG